MKSLKVLYLSEWYPSEKDQMMGLFVYKHAQAVAAQGCEVRVNTWWLHADIVQLNVLTLKKGLVAYVLKRVFGIPYIIVEHWSTYLPESGTYMRQARWKRNLLAEIAHEASGIYPVSQKLEDAMKACGIHNSTWGRVYNVVDDFFYQSTIKHQPSTIKHLLHVSCFDERAKNVQGLLRAVKALSEKRQDFVLTLVGTGKDWQTCREYAHELTIPNSMLRWTGEVSPQQVYAYIQKADAFILPSRYENAPVVLSECMAVGLPMVCTKVGGIPEMVHDDMGILVAPNDDTALEKAMDKMLNHYLDYDPQKIRQHGVIYSVPAVGKHFVQIYTSILSQSI